MSGCPVHSNDDAAPQSDDASNSIRWDVIFLTLAVGMLALVLAVSLQVP